MAALPARAQFYNDGNEPAGLRWYQIKTADYKVLYPQGMDSLARVYAAQLERVKGPVGATAGYTPNQLYKKQLPVILHPWTAQANGMVAWTPKRMELFTTPDFLDPLPEPWHRHLTIHESRHVSQMQYAYDKPYRVWNILFGQLFQGAMDILYCGPAFFEGDAVVAETELTKAGRGRNAAFLEFYRASFREGDTRDWWQWRYGSLKKFTPDHYTVGYITAAGMRSVYDTPDFTARYYRRMFAKKGWPFPFFNYPKTVKEVSGKRFRDAFSEISDTLRQRWSRDEAARAPFQPSEQLTAPGRHYTAYGGSCLLDSSLFSIRRGITSAPELVRTDTKSGRTTALRPFSYSTSVLKEDPLRGRIWWSEIVSDPRWGMISYSEIHYSDASGRTGCLKKRTRWYNPAVSPDGGVLCVVEYPAGGGSALLLVNPEDGSELARYTAPSGMQIVEAEWLGDRLYACAITDGGQGIYNVRDGFRRELACGHNTVKQLFVHDGTLFFISDLTGVDELYSWAPGEPAAYRITSTAVGSSSYRFSADGSSLLYSMLTKDGRYVYTTQLDSLPGRTRADFGVPHRYEFAEDLSGGGPGVIEQTPVEVPAPKPYNKFANAFRIHSWIPLYIDYDAVENLSFDAIASSAGLGATVFFQNELSTLQGTAAYNAAYSGGWVHKGEAKITYSGLYPVIEGGLSVSSAAPYWYFLQSSFSNFSQVLSLSHETLAGIPGFNASLGIYLPLNLSSGGWYRGVVPQLRWSLSNSIITRGSSAPMNRLSASVRAYIVKATPSSCVYPKLGIGAETGWSGRPGALSIFSSNAYFYTYGYLPGFMDTHGLRLSVMAQAPVGSAPFHERYASVMPRGMGAYTDLASQMASYPFQGRITADYVFPFLPLDWSGMGPVAYVRNLECTLHGDYAFAGGAAKAASLNLGGAGVELCAVLGNFLWIPYDTRIGVKYYYNLGIPSGLNPHLFDIVFTVDM